MCTGAVATRAAGGGNGALGSWIGAVALLAAGTGEVLTRAWGIGALNGVTGDVTLRAAGIEVVIGRGTDWVFAEGTGEVSSFGWVTPAPGRARRVMRTVSFFSGTAAVFAEGVGGGVGCVLLSLMMNYFVGNSISTENFKKTI